MITQNKLISDQLADHLYGGERNGAPIAQELSLSNQWDKGNARDLSAFLRTSLQYAFSNLVPSLATPVSDISYEVIGLSTVGNVFTGLAGCINSIQAGHHADDIGDKQGQIAATVDAFATGSLFAMGVIYLGARISTIGNIITNNLSSFWSYISSGAGGINSIGTYFALFTYLLFTISEWLRHPTKIFGKSFATKISTQELKNRIQKTQTELNKPVQKEESPKAVDRARIHYLKGRFGFDEENIETKINKYIKTEATKFGKTEQNYLKDLAIERMHTIATTILLETGQEQQAINKSLISTVVQYFITKTLGKTYEAVGRALVQETILQKKEEKMNRVFGKQNADIAREILKNSQPIHCVRDSITLDILYKGALKGRVATSPYTRDGKKPAFWSSTAKVLVYATGTLSMLCLSLACILGTLNPITATLITVGTILYILTSFCEMHMSWKNIDLIREEKTAPGKYDKLLPIISMVFIILSVAGMFIFVALTTALTSATLIPLIPALIIMLAWLFINISHIQAIDERKQNYLKALAAKQTLTLEEYRDLYVVTGTTMYFKRLNDQDQTLLNSSYAQDDRPKISQDNSEEERRALFEWIIDQANKKKIQNLQKHLTKIESVPPKESINSSSFPQASQIL